VAKKAVIGLSRNAFLRVCTRVLEVAATNGWLKKGR
jgi:hypothetical protein